MSAQSFEGFLARLYVNAEARARFRADPRGEAARAGLAEDEIRTLERIDWTGLEMAARSIEQKHRNRPRRWPGLRWLRPRGLP